MSSVLSSMCSLSDPETKAIVNEIIQDVAVKKGVKRTVEELVGDDTWKAFVFQIGCSFISRQRQERQQRRNDCLPTTPCNHISATLSKMARGFG